jgi:hypothetical protein
LDDPSEQVRRQSLNILAALSHFPSFCPLLVENGLVEKLFGNQFFQEEGTMFYVSALLFHSLGRCLVTEQSKYFICFIYM